MNDEFHLILWLLRVSSGLFTQTWMFSNKRFSPHMIYLFRPMQKKHQMSWMKKQFHSLQFWYFSFPFILSLGMYWLTSFLQSFFFPPNSAVLMQHANICLSEQACVGPKNECLKMHSEKWRLLILGWNVPCSCEVHLTFATKFYSV